MYSAKLIISSRVELKAFPYLMRQFHVFVVIIAFLLIGARLFVSPTSFFAHRHYHFGVGFALVCEIFLSLLF